MAVEGRHRQSSNLELAADLAIAHQSGCKQACPAVVNPIWLGIKAASVNAETTRTIVIKVVASVNLAFSNLEYN